MVIPGLPGEFPALKPLDARPNNLPTLATSFVGRAEQVADARRLLSSARLVTFTGPGGTGKTRLAAQVGGVEPDHLADGVSQRSHQVSHVTLTEGHRDDLRSIAMVHQPATQTRGFLFADLRDYTRFAESHGDSAAAELLARYRALVRDVIARFEAAEIRTEGDSFYVVFASASAAVSGGLAILEAADAAASQPGLSAIRVGVGVHAGETADTPEGYVGSAVNIAARICALAGPGELLVSETVRSLTRTLLGLQFVPRGRRRLKGIVEPIGVFRVLPATARDGAAARGVRARWRLAGWRLVAALAVGLAGVVLAVAAVAGILPGFAPTGRDGVSPPGAAGTDSSVGVSPDAGATSSPALTEAEAALLAKLPAEVSGDCAPASAAEGSAGGLVSLLCTLPLSADADEVWFDQFSTNDALARGFAEAVALAQAPAGDCATTVPAQMPWAVPNVHHGNLLCYETEGAAWLVWTYDDDRVLARARRGGDDWQAFLAWWRETAIFMR